MFLWNEDSFEIKPLSGCQIIDPQTLSGSVAFTSTLFQKKEGMTRFDHCIKELEALQPLAWGSTLHYRLPFPRLASTEQDSTLLRRLMLLSPKSHHLYINIPCTQEIRTYSGRKRLKSFFHELPKSNTCSNTCTCLFEIPEKIIEGVRFCTLSLSEMEQLLSCIKDIGFPSGFVVKQEHAIERMLATCLVENVSVESQIENLFEGQGHRVEKIQRLISLYDSIEDTVHDCVSLLLSLQNERQELEELYPAPVLRRLFLEIRTSSEQVLRKRGEKIPLSLSQAAG